MFREPEELDGRLLLARPDQGPGTRRKRFYLREMRGQDRARRLLGIRVAHRRWTLVLRFHKHIAPPFRVIGKDEKFEQVSLEFHKTKLPRKSLRTRKNARVHSPRPLLMRRLGRSAD